METKNFVSSGRRARTVINIAAATAPVTRARVISPSHNSMAGDSQINATRMKRTFDTSALITWLRYGFFLGLYFTQSFGAGQIRSMSMEWRPGRTSMSKMYELLDRKGQWLPLAEFAIERCLA